jgi:hypothetical protein
VMCNVRKDLYYRTACWRRRHSCSSSCVVDSNRPDSVLKLIGRPRPKSGLPQKRQNKSPLCVRSHKVPYVAFSAFFYDPALLDNKQEFMSLVDSLFFGLLLWLIVFSIIKLFEVCALMLCTPNLSFSMFWEKYNLPI